MKMNLTLFCTASLCIATAALADPAENENVITHGAPPPGMRSESVLKQIPDISAIGMFSGFVTSDKTNTDRNKLLVDSFETAFQGYVYPNIYMSFFPAIHRHDGNLEAELCEGYAEFQNIGAGFSLQVGKIHADVGEINKEHAHKRLEFDQPAVLTKFFGEHGLVGQGPTVRFLFPWSLFTELKLSAYTLSSGEHSHDEEGGGAFQLGDWAAIGKLKVSGALTDSSELEGGLSFIASKGPHYSEHQDDVIVGGADFRYRKWFDGYKRLTFRNELFMMHRQIPIGTQNRVGFYNFLEYRADKYLSTAIRHDWAEAVASGDRTQSISPIVAWNFTESTRLLAQYSYYLKNPDDTHQFGLQLVIGLGPHSHTMD
jgi:hypothetical protein